MSLPQEPWENYPQDWTKISKPSIDLMLSQCESTLKATIESADSISQKADKLVGIYIPIFTALGALVLNNLEKVTGDFLYMSASLCLILLAIGLYFCFQNVKKYTINIFGEYPDKILRTEYVDNDLPDDQKYVALSMAIIRNMKDRISGNEELILKRSVNNQIAIKVLFFIPLVPLVTFVAFRILPYIHCPS